MSTQQRDPRAKQCIRDDLVTFLYAPSERQSKLRLAEIIVKNCRLAGYQHKSFAYRDQFYCIDLNPPPRLKNRLVPQLMPEFDEYLQEHRRMVEEEIPLTTGYFTKVLNSSESYKDFMKLLPDAFHQVIKNSGWMCPNDETLTDFDVAAFKAENQRYINLIKQRLVRNLLL